MTKTQTGCCSFGDPALVGNGTIVLNVTRGVNSSTAATHPGGSDVTILTTGAAAGTDWDQVYANKLIDPASKCNTTANGQTDLGAVACTYVHDGFGVSVFSTGGSKDDLDINTGTAPNISHNWMWTDSSVPPSDEILDAFAAKYDHTATGGHEFLYFGADRWSVNGAKDMGFWFFKSAVSLNADGTFNGKHTLGDILALGTFTQGGAITSIRVFSWVGTGGDTNTVLQTAGSFPDCVPGGAADSGCNTVNNTTVPSPWAYQGSASTAVPGVFYAGALMEGGIDLTAIGATGCFSSFMAETRSSPSIGSQLKDFALGQFESCGASIVTQVSDDNFDLGGSVTDSATLHVTGGANPPTPTGFINFYLCGPTSGITSCSASGTAEGHVNLTTATGTPPNYTVQSTSVTPTVAGDYCFYAEYPASQDTNYPAGAFPADAANECFTVNPNQPGIVTNATAGPVDPGTAISDTATLTGTATPSNGLGGTITFNAYGPDDATCATSVYTSVADVTGNDDYNSETDGNGGIFAPTDPGTYLWIAAYVPDAGDVNNLSATTACGDPNESSIVQQFNPTLSTAQTVTIKDTATILDGGGGGDLAGTAHFQLFTDNQCTAGNEVAGTAEDVAVSGASPQTASTTPLTITDPGYSTLYWQVSYTSTNSAQTDIGATCTENSSLDIND